MTGLPELTLAFLGVAAGVVLWVQSRREPVWRWAALGTLAWGLGPVSGPLEQSLHLGTRLSPSDGLLVLGVVGWLWSLRQFEPKALPRLALGPLPALLAASYGLLTQPDLSPHGLVALTALLPVLFALPTFEAALRGAASEARLVWSLGLLLLAISTLAPVGLTTPLPLFAPFTMGLGFVLVGWGASLEGGDHHLSRGLLGFMNVGLVLGLVLLALDLREARVAPFALAAFAYLVLVALAWMGLTVYTRVQRAERRLELWIGLLQSLSSTSAATQALSPQGVMQSLLEGLKPLFDNLVGLEVRTDITQRAGQSGPYAHSFELALENPAEGRLYFSGPPRDERGLGALAPLLTERLRLSLTLNEWRSKAYTDPLTGLLNRRGYERQMNRLIRQSQETGKPITLALLDLDHFKRVNDTFGHAAGDEVLKALAELLRTISRADDLAVRLGGEEFCLVLSGAGLEDAGRMLERVRTELKGLRVSSVGYSLSFSGGVAGGEVPASMATVNRWLEQADKALYNAKQAGRDRVYSAAPQTLRPLK